MTKGQKMVDETLRSIKIQEWTQMLRNGYAVPAALVKHVVFLLNGSDFIWHEHLVDIAF
jgi:hypothetical protein